MGDSAAVERQDGKDGGLVERMSIKGAELCEADMETLVSLLGGIEVVEAALRDAAAGLHRWRETAERFGLLDEYLDCRLKFAPIWEQQLKLPSDLLEVVSGVTTAVVGYAGDVRQQVCYRHHEEREARREAGQAERSATSVSIRRKCRAAETAAPACGGREVRVTPVGAGSGKEEA